MLKTGMIDNMGVDLKIGSVRVGYFSELFTDIIPSPNLLFVSDLANVNASVYDLTEHFYETILPTT